VRVHPLFQDARAILHVIELHGGPLGSVRGDARACERDLPPIDASYPNLGRDRDSLESREHRMGPLPHKKPGGLSGRIPPPAAVVMAWLVAGWILERRAGRTGEDL
jgi:hypothetical protein